MAVLERAKLMPNLVGTMFSGWLRSVGRGSGRTSRVWVRTGVLLLAVVLLGTQPIGAARSAEDGSDPSLEYKVKAAFLLNFAKFVEWPEDAFEDADSPFTIGVLGRDPFGSLLDDTVREKAVQGRHVAVKRFSTVEDFEPCHILFICSSEGEKVAHIVGALRDSGVLTVGEMEQFAQRGGTVNFVLVENKVRFEINPAAAERNRLKISSKLLKLARIVEDERP